MSELHRLTNEEFFNLPQDETEFEEVPTPEELRLLRLQRKMGRAVSRDRHHAIHTRREWSARPSGLYLRNQPTLIKQIDRSVHVELHGNTPSVPVPDYNSLDRIARSFEPGKSTNQSIDNLCFSIQDAIKHPKTYSADRQVMRASIEALQSQKPYLKDKE